MFRFRRFVRHNLDRMASEVALTDAWVGRVQDRVQVIEKRLDARDAENARIVEHNARVQVNSAARAARERDIEDRLKRAEDAIRQFDKIWESLSGRIAELDEVAKAPAPKDPMMVSLDGVLYYLIEAFPGARQASSRDRIFQVLDTLNEEEALRATTPNDGAVLVRLPEVARLLRLAFQDTPLAKRKAEAVIEALTKSAEEAARA